MKKIDDPKEIDKKTNEYVDRLHFWTNHVIAQLSFSIDFFVVLGVGFLAFLVSRNDGVLLLEVQFIPYILAIVFVGFSIVFGCLSVLSRLKDLRSTRAIVQARHKAMKKEGCYLAESPIKDKAGLRERIGILLFRSENIRSADYDNDKDKIVDIKFNKLRRQSAILGKMTWSAHKLQILCFLFSISAYIGSLF